MLMEMFMRENGRKIKLMELANTIILMELSMRDSGRKISSMERVQRLGQMVQVTQEIMLMAKRMAMACSYGQMDLHIMASFWIIIFTGKAITFGLIRGNTRVIGLIIKCMVLDSSVGLMGECTMENTLMIKSKAMVSLTGQMAGNMKAIGIMENNMDREFIIIQKAKLKKVNGKRARESDG